MQKERKKKQRCAHGKKRSSVSVDHREGSHWPPGPRTRSMNLRSNAIAIYFGWNPTFHSHCVDFSVWILNHLLKMSKIYYILVHEEKKRKIIVSSGHNRERALAVLVLLLLVTYSLQGELCNLIERFDEPGPRLQFFFFFNELPYTR